MVVIVENKSEIVLALDGRQVKPGRYGNRRAIPMVKLGLDAVGPLEFAVKAKMLVRPFRRNGGHTVDRALAFVAEVEGADLDKAFDITLGIADKNIHRGPGTLAVSHAVVDDEIDEDGLVGNVVLRADGEDGEEHRHEEDNLTQEETDRAKANGFDHGPHGGTETAIERVIL